MTVLGINGYATAKGADTQLAAVHVFGRNTDIDIGTAPESVWGGAGVYTGQPTGAPELVTVVSGDVDDDGNPADTGARTVRIYGLLTSNATEETTEDIIMNGQTLVDSVNTWYRVYKVKVLTAGSSGTNEGAISVAHKTTTANIFSVMPALTGQSQVAAFTIPDKHKGWITDIRVHLARASGAAGSAVAMLQVREFGTGAWASIAVFDVTTQGPVDDNFNFPLPVPAKADIRVHVLSVSDDSTLVDVDIELAVEKL